MNKNKNIPELRFPEYTEEWEVKKYGEIFSFRTTNSYSREYLNYSDGEVKNIHYGDIHTKLSTLFDVVKEQLPYINSEVEIGRIVDDNYCKVGDLIIADASEDYEDVGKCIEIVRLNNEKVLAGLHTILARPDLYRMSIGFNGYLMKSEMVRLQIKTIAQGSKVLSISSKRLADISLNIPCATEQHKIATFLSAIDDKLQALKKKKALLEQYKKGVMQAIFSQQLRFTDVGGKDFPKWESKKLGEVFIYKNGGAFENSLVENGKFYLITLNSLDITGKLKQEHKRVNITDNSLQKGDLVMVLSDVAHGNFLGLTDIIPNDNYVLNQRMGALKLKITANIYYLKTFINFNQKYFKLKGQGSSQQNLSKGDICNFNISFPSLPEQTKIANFLNTIDEKINNCRIQIEKTEQYKKGLLQKMFC